MVTVKIPEGIYEKLKKVAEVQGLSIEGYVLSLIVESIDPNRVAESYWGASEDLLKQAREELVKGDLRQAGEKAWGAAALALKGLAYQRDAVRLVSHGELWQYVSKLEEEFQDKELSRLWRSASSMHVNFYEGWADKRHVEGAIEDVEKLLEKLKKLLTPHVEPEKSNN
jgi:HEPN domain-containing protein